MRKNFGVKSWTVPEPVLIIATYDESGNPGVMNAAWGGIYDTNQLMLCLSDDHKTTENIRLKKEFTVSFGTKAAAAACDYVGMVSGNQVPDKFAKAGFTAEKSEFTDAPLIKELPLAVECRLLKFNEDGIIVAEIVNVSADESILDEKGNIDLSKMDAIAFDPTSNTYRVVSEIAGKAFSDGRKMM